MRDEKLSTTVTPEEKQHFREIAAEDGMNMSQKLRELVYEEIEARGRSTTGEPEGNGPTATMATVAAN